MFVQRVDDDDDDDDVLFSLELEMLINHVNARTCVLTCCSFLPRIIALEIRELSVRGRPERGWSRRDRAVHDARGRARRQVLFYIMCFVLSSSFKSLFPV